MKKTQFGLLTLLIGMSLSTSAFAHDSIGFSLDVGEPHYYDPPPVYYAPPPVVYYEPRPVYHEYHEHHRRHEHDDGDD